MKTGKIKVIKAKNGYVIITNDTHYGVANNDKDLCALIGETLLGSYPEQDNDTIEIEITLLKSKIKKV